MAKYTCPPQKPSGSGTFADNLVGFQLVQGGGLTNSNFVFSSGIVAKKNRTFQIGTFSEPQTLQSLGDKSEAQSVNIFDKNFRIYPNFDETNILNFTNYGPLSKRFEDAALGIVNFFPAAIEVKKYYSDFTTGYTATNIQFDSTGNNTTLDINIELIRNPFDIDYSVNAKTNIKNLSYSVSKYRDITVYYRSYILQYSGQSYQLSLVTPVNPLTATTLTIQAQGNPFSLNGGTTQTNDDLIIRLNDTIVNEVFNLELDEVQEVLLNRYSLPLYTSSFKVPTEGDDGVIFMAYQTATWPLDGTWNIDIQTNAFTNYLAKLNTIAEEYDLSRTDLISRFYTTNAFQEFDTTGEKVNKVLKIYGRSFDETKKYIDGIKHVPSVNYNVGNDIPSALLVNFAQTLGWSPNISPIANVDYLTALYGTTSNAFPAYSTSQTIQDLSNQYYRNLILNSAYLYKSKGTRKAIDFLMEFIGVPDALLEFNENVYLADSKINLNRFDEQFAQIAGGNYIPEFPQLDVNNIYSLKGIQYTGFTSSTISVEVNLIKTDYPVDELGYPTMPEVSDSYFFQQGEGWFEQTPQHQSPEIINNTTSVFTGQNYDIQTQLEPFTYGQKYLDRYRIFPYLNMGYSIKKQTDNRKSWTAGSKSRINNDNLFDSYYSTMNDKLILNVKNIEIFLNPAQALVYDVWHMSQTNNYPIPFTGMSSPFPQTGGTDWTFIDPKPQIKTFYQFYKTFWKNMINVRNRQISSDGKTSGYPTLQSLYWKYLTMYQDTGIQNDNFNYQNMIEYVNGLGDYWIRVIEQFIPASTIWNTGTKFENSIFHRQKFIYRLQRGCQLVTTTSAGAVAVGGVTPPCSPKIFNVNLISLAQLIAGFNDTSVISRQYYFQFIIGSTTFNFILPTIYTQSNLFPTSSSDYLDEITSVINSYNFINVGFILNTAPELTAIDQITFSLQNVSCTYSGIVGSLTFGTINETYI